MGDDSGSSAAALTTSLAFSWVRPDMPTTSAILSRVLPGSRGGKFPPRLAFCFNDASCAAFASAANSFSNAEPISTPSLGRKSLRNVFSAYSPRTMSSSGTTVTDTFSQAIDLTAFRRRAPAMSLLSGVTTMGCSSPTSAILCARRSISPMTPRSRAHHRPSQRPPPTRHKGAQHRGRRGHPAPAANITIRETKPGDANS